MGLTEVIKVLSIASLPRFAASDEGASRPLHSNLLSLSHGTPVPLVPSLVPVLIPYPVCRMGLETALGRHYGWDYRTENPWRVSSYSLGAEPLELTAVAHRGRRLVSRPYFAEISAFARLRPYLRRLRLQFAPQALDFARCGLFLFLAGESSDRSPSAILAHSSALSRSVFRHPSLSSNGLQRHRLAIHRM